MAAVELYRTTGKPEYLELAQTFLDMRNLVTDGGDDNQDLVPFAEQREAVGHAVRANYLYAGAADLYAETGDEPLMTPLTAHLGEPDSEKALHHRRVRCPLRRRFARWQ